MNIEPIRNCIDLSKAMIGTRGGVFHYTESFRIDFENKMYRLAKLERELEELKTNNTKI